MSEAPGEAAEKLPGGRSLWIAAASALAAVSALAISTIAGRSLNPTAFREFTAYWALLFGAFSVMGGVQNESTRAVTSVRVGATPRARIVPVAVILSAVVAGVVLATSPWWWHALLPHSNPVVAPVAAVAIVAFTVQSALSGSVAGMDRWGPFAGLMAADALVRLLVVLAVVVVGTTLTGLELAVAVPGLLVVLVGLAWPVLRRAIAQRADVDRARLARHLFLTLFSSAAYSVLVVGFPALLNVTARHGNDAEVATLLAAISLTRAPVMMPLLAFQGVAVAAFTAADPSRRLGVLVKPLAAVGLIGALGSVAAWLLGPWLFRLLYGSGQGYGLPGWAFCGLVLAAVTLAWLTLTGTATLAASAHRAYMLGWVAAAAVAVAMLWLPVPIVPRAIAALGCGPLVGVAIHLAAIRVVDAAAQTEMP